MPGLGAGRMALLRFSMSLVSGWGSFNSLGIWWEPGQTWRV